jgi:hypothetical protein
MHYENGKHCADLAENRLGSHRTEAGHFRQVNSEDPIEFAANFEHTRLTVPVTTARKACSPFGSYDQGALASGERRFSGGR